MGRLRSLFFHRRAPLVVAVVAAAILWTPYLRSWLGGGVREVSVAEAAALMGRPGAAILDANVWEIYLDGHLPGAAHVSPLELAEVDLPASRDAALLFYCKSPH
jgi:hypothetical protein